MAFYDGDYEPETDFNSDDSNISTSNDGVNKAGFCTSNSCAKGCAFCVNGSKMVLFITGICSQKCTYCPVSEKKFGSDDIYANEWKIKSKEDMYEEIRLTNALGAGITGGDPLAKLDRCVEYIKDLKEKYGPEFHIHLYTIFKLASYSNLKKLYDAGLDEIRFHPNVDFDKDWDEITQALKFDWDVGIEIPCLPDKEEETKKLIDFYSSRVKFINLNELEFSDTTVAHYNMSGYNVRDDGSYAAAGSKELALKLVKYAKKSKSYDTNASVYFCSARLKDKTQLGNRIKRRAHIAAKVYDEVTDEGMLIRGVIYLSGLKTGTGYRAKIEGLTLNEKNVIISKLNSAKDKILDTIDETNMEVDVDKFRILTYAGYVEHFAEDIKKLGFVPAIIEEYPTKDATEIEVEFL